MASQNKGEKIMAETIMKHLNAAENMALAGSYEHHQFVSGALMHELARIKFVLKIVLNK